MDTRTKSTTYRILRALVLLTAVANVGGNVLILLFYRPIMGWVGAPIPRDLFSFTFVSGFSFTVGVLAGIIYWNPEKNLNLVVAAILGKGIFAALTAYFYGAGELHWFYRVFGVWDAVYTFVFFLFFVHLVSPDLTALNGGQVFRGVDPTPRTKRALILTFSMSGNGTRAVERVSRGLASGGYEVRVVNVEVVDEEKDLFQFPFKKRLAFFIIMVRAILRLPVKIRPLPVAADHDYDLVVVESQTWFVGISAPIEAIFQAEANRGIFTGRDVATVNVCRGLWRRPQAMLVRWVEACGGHVIGARAFSNPGREPIRTFSLFLFLGLGGTDNALFRSGVLTAQFLSDDHLAELERFGAALAARAPALAPHAAREGAS
jgi:hypothetical protein